MRHARRPSPTPLRPALGALAAAALAAAAGCDGAEPRTAAAQPALAPNGPVAVVAPATPAESGFVGIARRVTPAVVYIEAEYAPAAARGRGGDPFDLIPPNHPLLPPGAGPRRRAPTRGSGSGFFISGDGYILTNNHVVADARRLNVTLFDRRIFPATVVGRDPSTDVALIKIDARGMQALPFGDDRGVQVGQPVLAIGSPLGLQFTVTSGIVSAKERGGNLAGLLDNDFAVADFIQTDAVINPGNSGGPLVDLSGRAIGINTAIESPTGVFAGYGFAVPATIARVAVEQIRRYGRVRRAILGVSIQDVTATDARAAGLREVRGALVGGFTEGSPAERAGLEPGDVILAVDGTPVNRVSELQRVVYGYQPGQTVTLTLQRYGDERTARLTLAEAPAPRATATASRPAPEPASTPASRLGVTVAAPTGQLASELRLPPGTTGVVVSEVDPSGPAAGLLIPRDVITAVLGGRTRRPVRTPQELTEAAAAAPNGVVSLLVLTAGSGGTRVVNVPVGR